MSHWFDYRSDQEIYDQKIASKVYRHSTVAVLITLGVVSLGTDFWSSFFTGVFVFLLAMVLTSGLSE